MMMPQRRAPIAPQGLDIAPMQPAAPMQFAVPPPDSGGGMEGLASIFQQLKPEEEEGEGGGGPATHEAGHTGGMQIPGLPGPADLLPRKKMPFANIMQASNPYGGM